MIRQKGIESLPGIRENVSLAAYTTFKIGGPARWFFEAGKVEEIIRAIEVASQFKIPYFILGGGSNILVSDRGFRGLVIKITTTQVKVLKETLLVESGVSLGKVLEIMENHSLSGLEFVAGIPGVMGGAIRGNAGAWQEAVGDKIIRVRVLTPDGEIKWLKATDCGFSYRQSRFKESGEIILEAELKLKLGNKEEIRRKILENLEKRKNQPKEPSAGCVFLNPKPYSAGVLIDRCGLKGKRMGDAQISPKHANFIINLGCARAYDVISLIKLIRGEVKKKFGVLLEPEICFLGFPSEVI